MNENFYDNNKRLLSLKYPKIAQKLDEHLKADLQVQVIPARDNSLTMSVVKNDSSIFLHSKYKPQEEAERWAKALSIDEQAVIALFGFGLGYHVFEMVKLLNKENYLLVYEPSIDVFSEVIKHIDLREIIECDNVILAVDYDVYDTTTIMEFCTTWTSINYTFIKYVPSYPIIFQEEFSIFCKSINDVLSKMQMLKNTIIAFARDWQYNLFKNLTYVVKSHRIDDFYDCFKGKPIVIVSAGPSLNKNVQLLREINEKAVIICVDTALKVLLRERIKPHFIITIDGSLMNYEKFKDIEYNDIPLVYTPKCYYEILTNHTGEKVLFSSNDLYVKSLLEQIGVELGNLDTGGSVANNACSLAMKMGADPIIFIGQDLAFTNNQSHANGSMYDGKNEIDDENKLMQVEGFDGNPVMTNNMFYVFKQWFEKTIKNDDSGRVYINATEGGAKIDGTKIMTFRETIDQYCREDIDVNGLIQKVFNSESIYNKKNILELAQTHKGSIKELNYVLAKSAQGSSLSLMLFNAYNTSKNFSVNSILKKLDQIDKEIRKKKEKFTLINYIIQPLLFILNEYLGIRKFESEIQKGMHIAKTSKILYDGMKEAIELVKPWIEECIMELENLSLDTKEV